MPTALFKKVDYSLKGLIEDIKIGDIGLPEIQRPFVWPNAKVRDLFDSMFRGFPVGYLLFWENMIPDGFKQVGNDLKQKVPHLLIVDGQQRLTSLYAVLTGTAVIRENYQSEHIKIAFRPSDGTFQVSNAAIVKDPEFIPDISELWAGVGSYKFANLFMERLLKQRPIDDAEEERLRNVIDQVRQLESYPFTAMELAGSVSEEDVAEVFVRINSKGTPLNQADFILTLMSVFWDKGRKSLEEFCRAARQPALGAPSSFNHFLQPDPDQLLRVEVALGFRRARLQYVYSILRGKDLETEKFSEQQRDEQFAALADAQEYTLDLINWHEFFKAVLRAGYRRGQMVTSKVGLLYTYAMYLIGKKNFGVDHDTLRDAIARWFFMSALTGRYTASPETVMDQDLARLREVKDAEGFVNTLDRVIGATLTNDYWDITLPIELATSSAFSPTLFAYYAALNLLHANVLFSKLSVSELLDPAIKPKKAALDRHHLFPKAHLAKLHITSSKEVNQIANYALVEWPDNIDISGDAPSEYWPSYAAGYSDEDLDQMQYWHALPNAWETMDYPSFLVARRKLLAQVIRDGFGVLLAKSSKTAEAERSERAEAKTERGKPSAELIAAGEGAFVEFKQSARWSHINGDKEKTSEDEIVRALCGFMNAKGGTLFVGVADHGNPVGLRTDYKSIQGHPNQDGFENWLTGVLRGKMGAAALANLAIRFELFDEQEVCRIDAEPAPAPVFAQARHFYVRFNNTTQELSGPEMLEYQRRRWPKEAR